MLDDGSAGLDPISGVQVEMASGVADHGVVVCPQITPWTPCRAASAPTTSSKRLMKFTAFFTFSFAQAESDQ
jgi:hypothetical protein